MFLLFRLLLRPPSASPLLWLFRQGTTVRVDPAMLRLFGGQRAVLIVDDLLGGDLSGVAMEQVGTVQVEAQLPRPLHRGHQRPA